MTDQEKGLLCDIYPMEERIMAGQLYGYQVEALESYRAGLRYLYTTYPGYSFETLSIAPATKFDPWMIIRIQSGDSGIWQVKVTPEQNGYTFADTFYNVPLAAEYDRLLENVLNEAGFPVIYANTEFTAFRTGLGPDTTAEDLMLMGRDLQKMTHIYIRDPGNAAEQHSAKEVLQTALKNAEACGAYIL